MKSITTTLDFTNFETLRGVSLPTGFGGVDATDSDHLISTLKFGLEH
ncbi:MAG: hypothetical protein V9G25_09655 [Acidimicrobiia bacterium]